MSEETNIASRETQSARDGVNVAARDGGAVNLTAAQVEGLAARIAGRLLRPGEPGWSEAISTWNGMATRVPAFIVQPADARDAAIAVSFARDHGLLLGVKGGGHHIAGLGLAENGLTLDMSLMREVSVDPSAKRAFVGPGCLLRDVDEATQRRGLATVLGFVSEVGVAGLTLGGGLGYLTRRFGWTVDNLEAVEIVTADGALRSASRDEHPDLFWAIRGGGGNFGVVTRFTYRLHAVGPTVFGGLIAWPFARAGEILRAYRALTEDAPRELAAWLMLLRAPPAPFVPEAWRGERICAMAVCFSGDLDRAEAALAPVRALGEPILDLLAPQPYVQLQSYLDDTEPRGMHYYWKTEYLSELADGLLDALVELFAACPIPDADFGILHLAGALNERDADDGAVGNRDARFVIGAKGMWPPEEPEAEAFRRWIGEAGAKIRPYGTGGSYVNFQTADEGEAHVRASYGRNFRRLAEIKRKYDPDNLFRTNRNVPPLAEGQAPDGL